MVLFARTLLVKNMADNDREDEMHLVPHGVEQKEVAPYPRAQDHDQGGQAVFLYIRPRRAVVVGDVDEQHVEKEGI